MTIEYLTLEEVLELHRRAIELYGGAPGVRDLGGVASAVAQPQATFDGQDLHPTIAGKAAALGFAIGAAQHFVDGNKRTAHAAMETFLVLNGYELTASDDEQVHAMEWIAEAMMNRVQLADWIQENIRPVHPSAP